MHSGRIPRRTVAIVGGALWLAFGVQRALAGRDTGNVILSLELRYPAGAHHLFLFNVAASTRESKGLLSD